MTERYLSNMIECDESNARAVYKLLPSIEGKEGIKGRESSCSAMLRKRQSRAERV